MSGATAVLFPKVVVTTINGKQVKLYKNIHNLGEVFENMNNLNHTWFGCVATFASIMGGFALPLLIYDIWYGYQTVEAWHTP